MTTTEDSVDIMRVMVHVVDSEDVSTTVVCPIFGVVCHCGPYVSRDATRPDSHEIYIVFPHVHLMLLLIFISDSLEA